MTQVIPLNDSMVAELKLHPNAETMVAELRIKNRSNSVDGYVDNDNDVDMRYNASSSRMGTGRRTSSRVSNYSTHSIVDYGLLSPVPPPVLPEPHYNPVPYETYFPADPSRGPVTQFNPRPDTAMVVSDVGVPYWQMEVKSVADKASPASSSSGIVSNATSSYASPAKKSVAGSDYGAMYGNLTADDHQSIHGLRRRPVTGMRRLGSMEDVRHRKDDDESMSGGAACCLSLLVALAQILLNGVLALVLYWVIKFHTKDGASFPFAWKEDPILEFNLHPVLMITGLIYCSGQAMLFYRTCRCCRRIWNKLFHATFHMLAIPCIVIGFIAVLDSHNLRTDAEGRPAPIPNFYSLHSWMGLTTMGIFALQFVVGFFSFLLLLCCESATASFRASLVPIHNAFGITTFVLAVATACAGFTEKAFFHLSIGYTKWVPYLLDPRFNTSAAFAGINTLGPSYTIKMFEESLLINVMGGCLIALVLIMPVVVINPRWRFRPARVITVTHDRYE